MVSDNRPSTLIMNVSDENGALMVTSSSVDSYNLSIKKNLINHLSNL